MLIGSFGLFMTLFLLFCRFLPMVATAEVKTVMASAHAGHGKKHYKDVATDDTGTADYRRPQQD